MFPGSLQLSCSGVSWWVWYKWGDMGLRVYRNSWFMYRLSAPKDACSTTRMYWGRIKALGQCYLASHERTLAGQLRLTKEVTLLEGPGLELVSFAFFLSQIS
jgi:hypothetical protein